MNISLLKKLLEDIDVSKNDFELTKNGPNFTKPKESKTKPPCLKMIAIS